MKSCSVLLLCCFLPLTTCGRVQTTGKAQDTTESRVRILDPGISSGKPVFLLPPFLRVIPDYLASDFSEFPSLPPPLLSGAGPGNIDLIAPFKLQLAREQELRTLRTILGTVQLGGAAYLVYRQLKKKK